MQCGMGRKIREEGWGYRGRDGEVWKGMTGWMNEWLGNLNQQLKQALITSSLATTTNRCVRENANASHAPLPLQIAFFICNYNTENLILSRVRALVTSDNEIWCGGAMWWWHGRCFHFKDPYTCERGCEGSTVPRTGEGRKEEGVRDLGRDGFGRTLSMSTTLPRLVRWISGMVLSSSSCWKLHAVYSRKHFPIQDKIRVSSFGKGPCASFPSVHGKYCRLHWPLGLIYSSSFQWYALSPSTYSRIHTHTQTMRFLEPSRFLVVLSSFSFLIGVFIAFYCKKLLLFVPLLLMVSQDSLHDSFSCVQ
jgi:hypothetical protein